MQGQGVYPAPSRMSTFRDRSPAPPGPCAGALSGESRLGRCARRRGLRGLFLPGDRRWLRVAAGPARRTGWLPRGGSGRRAPAHGSTPSWLPRADLRRCGRSRCAGHRTKGLARPVRPSGRPGPGCPGRGPRRVGLKPLGDGEIALKRGDGEPSAQPPAARFPEAGQERALGSQVAEPLGQGKARLKCSMACAASPASSRL